MSGKRSSPSATGPTSGFLNIRLMWSAMSIRTGGRKVWRMPPAALVTTSVVAQSREHARGERGNVRSLPLIQMKASALHHDRHALERPADELALVARGTRLGEARDVLVWDAHRVVNRVGHAREARAEDDRGAWLELAQTLRYDVRRGADPVGHNSIPASVADRKFASVPAIMARNPSRARSCLRSGTSAPIPPIWMPTELILAKPHSANVAMVNDTGSSCALIGPSCA